MTTSGSYTFYSTPAMRERKAGSAFTRVFVSDRKITVYSKTLVQTAKSRVLFEKTFDQITFKLCHNSSGAPYLKVFSKSPSGKINDVSLAYYNEEHYNTITHNAFIFVESNILQWFVEEQILSSNLVGLNEVKHLLLFPVFRNTSRMEYYTLQKLKNVKPTLVKSLRENNTWFDFLKEVCPNTVKTSEDEAYLSRFNELLPLAAMNLGRTITEIDSQYGSSNLLSLMEFLSTGGEVAEFMFANLTQEERNAALDLCQISPPHEKLSNMRVSKDVLREPLKMIPATKRHGFAKVIFETIESTFTDLKISPQEEQPYPRIWAKVLPPPSRLWTTVLPHLQTLYWADVTKPALRTTTTLEQVDEKFFDLYGRAFTSEFNIYTTDDDITFCTFPQKMPPYYSSQLSVRLVEELGTKVPKSRASENVSGFVDEEGKFVALSNVYSLEDAMFLAQKTADLLDESLRKLGRDITPENRVSYLTFPSKERKFKNTWKYYDLGVTDPVRIIALKQAKVNKKADIVTFNDLPDQMFSELLQLEAGFKVMSRDTIWIF